MSLMRDAILEALSKYDHEATLCIPSEDIEKLATVIERVAFDTMQNVDMQTHRANTITDNRPVYLIPAIPGALEIAQRLSNALPGSVIQLTHDEMALALEIVQWPLRTGSR